MNGCIKSNICQKMKITIDLMIWSKTLMNGQWFPICILHIQVHKQATKNKICSLIYQIFIEHLLHQDLPNAVGSWNVFRCTWTFTFFHLFNLFILMCNSWKLFLREKLTFFKSKLIWRKMLTREVKILRGMYKYWKFEKYDTMNHKVTTKRFPETSQMVHEVL